MQSLTRIKDNIVGYSPEIVCKIRNRMQIRLFVINTQAAAYIDRLQ